MNGGPRTEKCCCCCCCCSRCCCCVCSSYQNGEMLPLLLLRRARPAALGAGAADAAGGVRVPHHEVDDTTKQWILSQTLAYSPKRSIAMIATSPGKPRLPRGGDALRPRRTTRWRWAAQTTPRASAATPRSPPASSATSVRAPAANASYLGRKSINSTTPTWSGGTARTVPAGVRQRRRQGRSHGEDVHAGPGPLTWHVDFWDCSFGTPPAEAFEAVAPCKNRCPHASRTPASERPQRWRGQPWW